MILRLQGLACLLLILLSRPALSFTKGFNQAWLKNNYSSQFLNPYYDQKYVEALFDLNQKANSKLLRIWLFEGTSLNQFSVNLQQGKLNLRPDFLKNLNHFLSTARKYGIKISITFLDGNVFSQFRDNQVRDFWLSVFNQNTNERKLFFINAIKPIYKLINSSFLDVVSQIDLVNEVNALKEYGMFENDQNLKRFICEMKKEVPVAYTASLGWANAEELFFSGLLDNACLDFYDIHLYNDEGIISRCDDYLKLSKQGVHFQLGEFGQASLDYNEELQSKITFQFITQAKSCGFKSALAWRLLDVREGHNPEARFSYLSFNRPRQAFYIFRDL